MAKQFIELQYTVPTAKTARWGYHNKYQRKNDSLRIKLLITNPKTKIIMLTSRDFNTR